MLRVERQRRDMVNSALCLALQNQCFMRTKDFRSYYSPQSSSTNCRNVQKPVTVSGCRAVFYMEQSVVICCLPVYCTSSVDFSRSRTQRHGSYSDFISLRSHHWRSRQSSLATSVRKDRLQGRRADLSDAAWWRSAVPATVDAHRRHSFSV